MFDFGLGAPELLVIAVVAIIVVGPKDLPRLLKTIGQVMTKVRAMAREFQGHLEDASREAGLDDLKQEFKEATDFNVPDLDDHASEINKVFDDITTPASENAAKEPAEKKTTNSGKTATKKKAAERKPAAAKPAKSATKPKAKKKPAAKSAVVS